MTIHEDLLQRFAERLIDRVRLRLDTPNSDMSVQAQTDDVMTSFWGAAKDIARREP